MPGTLMRMSTTDAITPRRLRTSSLLALPVVAHHLPLAAAPPHPLQGQPSPPLALHQPQEQGRQEAAQYPSGAR